MQMQPFFIQQQQKVFSVYFHQRKSGINTNQQQKGLHIDKNLHEEVKAIDDFHLHVRNKLDKTAQLN